MTSSPPKLVEGPVTADSLGWTDTTYALLQRSAERFGGAPALTWLRGPDALDRPASWSFQELLGEVTRAANLFSNWGIGRGDVVAYVLANHPATHFVLWGAEAVGTAFAINPALSAEMILSLLRAMRAKVLVLEPGALAEEARIGLTGRLAVLPDLKGVLTVGPGRLEAPGLRAEPLEAALASQLSDRLMSPQVPTRDGISSAFCTGGTTGAPKIALRTHGAEAANAHMLAQALGDNLRPGDRVFCGLPLFHVNASSVTGIGAWVGGANVVLGPPDGYRDRWLIENFWRVVERFRINSFAAVPTIYSLLLGIPVLDADVSSLRVGFCGAAPMPVELFRRFESTTGIRILEGYGLTETTCTSTLNPAEGERRIGSIGVPLPHCQVRIVGLGGAGGPRACEPGEVGAVAITGPHLFAGYRNPTDERGIWLDLGDGQRWLDSGDLGRVDADGFFWLAGRRKELIIRGGHNIDPKLIEEAMHRHPDVRLAAAVGRPDAHSGEVPVFYVELNEGARADAATLRAFARQAVADRAAAPKEVIIVERLPTTAVGKLFKLALRQREVEDVVAREARVAGVTHLHVKVSQEPGGGFLAQIALEEINEALTRGLSQYPFKTIFRTDE